MRKGFTLLEVLIVVIIIGILAAIALPQYVSTIEKARSSEALGNVGSLRASMDRYWYEHSATYVADRVSTDPIELDIDSPNSVTGRLYNYTVTDVGTVGGRKYTIRANRSGDTTFWVQWTQTSNTSGKMTKADELGGPES